MKILDEKNKGLGRMLFSLKQSIDLEKLLGLNADVVNEIGIGNKFFGHIQMLLMEACAINICKIFEKEKKYPLNSIPAILNIIKNNKINYKYSEYIDKFISKYGKSNNKRNYIDTLEIICKNFYSKHKVSFTRYDYARDKIIAHSEQEAQINSLPSHKAMKEIALFGIDFYYMINRAFLDMGPHPIHSDNQTFSSLYILLEKLGCKNIKTDFDK